MGEITKIEWTDRTWSPWRGCTKVSEGCARCYAERQSVRNPKTLGVWGPNGKRVLNANWAQLVKWDREAFNAGARCRVFPSLCDPFEDFGGQMSNHKGELLTCNLGTPYMMDDARREFFSTTILLKSIDWLVLTKRPENIPRMLLGPEAFHENVWLGTSVENQAAADERIPALLKCRKNSPVLWLSVEPLLGRVEFKSLEGIDWVIVGGESGPGARPCDVAWIRSIVEQCRDAGVPVFVKQLGASVRMSFDEWNDLTEGGNIGSPKFAHNDPNRDFGIWTPSDSKGGDPEEWPADLRVREFPEVERSSIEN